MASERDMSIELAGWMYKLWTDEIGNITHTACAGRWERCGVVHLDDWTRNKLQRICDEFSL